MRTKSDHEINVCNAGDSFIIKVFISKEICRISICYFVIFNKAETTIEKTWSHISQTGQKEKRLFF